MNVLLCDLDETLIDTRDHVLECTRRTLEAHGKTFTIQELEKHVKRHGTVHNARRKLGLSDEQFYEGRRNVFLFRPSIEEAIAMEFVKEIKDAKKLLRAAKKKGYAIGVVTSSDWFETHAKLELLGTNVHEVEQGNSIIDAVMASDQEDLKKPHAEPALMCMGKLGFYRPDQGNIVFIGDSDADMGCATNLKRLGFAVKGVLLNHYDKEYEKSIPEADVVVTSLKEAIKEL